MKKVLFSFIAVSLMLLTSCMEEIYDTTSSGRITKGRRVVTMWGGQMDAFLRNELNTIFILNDSLRNNPTLPIGKVYSDELKTIRIKRISDQMVRAVYIGEKVVCVETDGNLIDQSGAKWKIWVSCDVDFAKSFIGVDDISCPYLEFSYYENFVVNVTYNGNVWRLSARPGGDIQYSMDFEFQKTKSSDGLWVYDINGSGKMPNTDSTRTYESQNYMLFEIYMSYTLKDFKWVAGSSAGWLPSIYAGEVDIDVYKRNSTRTFDVNCIFTDGVAKVTCDDITETFSKELMY
ncbi:MAG: hypothetical protein HUJ96_06750 [Marinilabiliaceae bacterium]|nr:hypothetical protein [Marinilabiliaceae bacterium]